MRIHPTITRPTLIGRGNRPFIVGIDPGKRSIAWAVVRRSTTALVACGFPRGDSYVELAAAFRADLARNRRLENLDAIANSEVWAEIPRIYPPEKQPGDQNDLVPLAWVSGIAAGTLLRMGAQIAEPVQPSRWKGQRDGDVHAAYVQRLLNVAERRMLDGIPGGLRHNVLDAIGIALWKAGRR